MPERERGILLGGSIEIMNKKGFGVCHRKIQHFNYGGFPRDQAANTVLALKVPLGVCITAKLIMFASVVLIYTLN